MLHGLPRAQGLYDPSYEHDACGVGFSCHIKGVASHKIVDDALTILENMNHRGACGCDPNSGDGPGILVRTPDKFLRHKCKELVARRECESTLERIAQENGMKILGWRDVPVRNRKLGQAPRESEPKIRQCFVAPAE